MQETRQQGTSQHKGNLQQTHSKYHCKWRKSLLSKISIFFGINHSKIFLEGIVFFLTLKIGKDRKNLKLVKILD